MKIQIKGFKMKRLKKYEKQRFESPTDDLLGLFSYISRSLQASAVTMNENGRCFLRMQSLQVDYAIRHEFENEY